MQLRSIVAVRESLPQQLHLIVQEHPSYDFPSMSHGYMARSTFFSEAIARLPGVSLVPAGTVGRREIASLAGVVTITGTVGLEARLRGVPALCLGFPWYRWVVGLVSSSVEEFVAQMSSGKGAGDLSAQEALLEFLRFAPSWPTGSDRMGSPGPTDELLGLLWREMERSP